MKLASFDLEIAKELPDDGNDWKDYHPLGITCAAIAFSDKEEVKYWHDSPQLSKEQCIELVHDLQEIVDDGYTLLTWNGMGFDFLVLAQESGLFKECGNMAMQHVDMMLIVTFTKGWFLGLDKALAGAGLKGKLKTVTLSDGTELNNMHGAMAPSLWAKGECDAVLKYLKDDVIQPLKLAQHILETKKISWMSGTGKLQSVNTRKLFNVIECFDIPEPDVSWMTAPPTRKQFIEWVPGID